MRYAIFLLGAILFSSPAFSQTQQAQPSSNSVTIGTVLVTGAGVVTGVLIGDYLLGGNMTARLVGGYTQQMGRYGGFRGFPLGTGLVRTAVLVGSGILGGYVANSLTK